MKKIYLFLLLFLTCFSVAYAQEGDQWFVSPDIGINFKCSPPEAYSLFPNLTNNSWDSVRKEYSGNNCTSISDTNGNLLFYATYLSLYNRNRQIMPHGRDSLQLNEDQDGGYIIDNSIFMVPDPGNINRYYVFFIDLYGDYTKSSGVYDVCYALVDMRMDNGLGDVVSVKRHILKQNFPDFIKGVVTDNFANTNTYGLNGIRKKNKHDFWVTTIEFFGSSYPKPAPDSLVVFSVTASGVTWHRASLGYRNESGPQSVFTPDGKRVAVYENINDSNRLFMLYNFDDNTGSISNPLRIKIHRDLGAVAFSPDNTKMYLYSTDGAPLYQYDVTAGNDTAAINHSVQMIASDTLPPGYSDSWEDLRLASDGKIYGINSDPETMGVTGSGYLRAIESPNEPGAKCMPNDYSVKINLPPPPGVNYGTYSPGYPPHFITRKQEIMPYDISGFCSNSPVVFTPFKNFYSPTYHWDFGDPASAGSNTSTQRTGMHLYKTPGTYKVHFAAWNYDSIMDTFTRFVCISEGLDPVKTETLLCSGETVTLDAGNPGAKYFWNTPFASPWLQLGDTMQTKTVSPNDYWAIVKNGNYRVTVTNGSCSIIDSFHIINASTAKINLGKDTTIHAGTTLTLHSGYPTTVWSTGATGDTIQVTKAGSYWAMLKGDKCEISDTIVVKINSGIDNNAANGILGLRIYPNPAYGTLNISFNTADEGQYKLNIYNQIGKLVLEQKYGAALGANILDLNISSLAPGSYILKMVSPNSTATRKFEVGSRGN